VPHGQVGTELSGFRDLRSRTSRETGGRPLRRERDFQVQKAERVSPTPGSTAYALALGYLLGYHGQRLLETLWAKVLDVSTAELVGLAHDAKRLGILDIKQAGEIIEINFPTLLTAEERQLRYGSD
jgi:hypothetical protein